MSTSTGEQLFLRLEAIESRVNEVRESLDAAVQSAGLKSTELKHRKTRDGDGWDAVVETGKLRTQLTELRQERRRD